MKFGKDISLTKSIIIRIVLKIGYSIKEVLLNLKKSKEYFIIF